MVEPAEHGNGLDAAFAPRHPWNRLLLSERLVRTRLVVEAHVLGDETPQVLIAQDQDVVEQLPAHGKGAPSYRTY